MDHFNEFESIGAICRSKYHKAQCELRDFDVRKCHWILGRDVVDILEEYCNSGPLMELMGITVQVDTFHPGRISLYKEIE